MTTSLQELASCIGAKLLLDCIANGLAELKDGTLKFAEKDNPVWDFYDAKDQDWERVANSIGVARIVKALGDKA